MKLRVSRHSLGRQPKATKKTLMRSKTTLPAFEERRSHSAPMEILLREPNELMDLQISRKTFRIGWNVGTMLQTGESDHVAGESRNKRLNILELCDKMARDVTDQAMESGNRKILKA